MTVESVFQNRTSGRTPRPFRRVSACALIGALVVLLLTGCATPTAAPPPDDSPAPQFSEGYTLGVGDQLTINVWRNRELTVNVPVRPDGMISMPLLGDIEVGGKAPEAVARAVEEQLQEFVRDPQVSVIVNAVGSNEYLTRVRVTGAVRAPLSLPFRPGMTVMDVILEAGGPTEFANLDQTRLYRPGEDARSIRLEAILESGDLSTNYTLRPGDVITVPESRF